MANPNDLIDRKQLITKLGISDNSERRARQRGGDWPPHLLIGAKVYYRVGAVNDWILRREAHCRPTVADDHCGHTDAEVNSTTGAF